MEPDLAEPRASDGSSTQQIGEARRGSGPRGDRSERSSPRLKVFLGAEVQGFVGGGPTTHRVRDLSATGACIDQAASLRPSSTLLISVGTLEAVAASVVWVRDGLAGIRFATTIDVEAARSNSAIRVRKPGLRPATPR